MRPLISSREGVDLLVALNQETVQLHQEELAPDGVIIYDASQVRDLPARGLKLPHGAGHPAAGERGGRDRGQRRRLRRHPGAASGPPGAHDGPAPGGVCRQGRRGGGLEPPGRGGRLTGWGRPWDSGYSLAAITPPPAPRLLISGHEALALGALAAGLQFISGYPMTPWSSVLNAVGQRAARWGVVVEQAEDEIAAINLALGASFAGVRALTGSSGGGFSLMVETLGLAGCSETPLVIVEAQRPGPSTGLPTRTGQGDLSFVLSAGQGDFPRAVLAPGTPAQAFAQAARAFNLADRYQLPVIILTDQYLADANFTQEAGDFPEKVEIERALELGAAAAAYERYAITADGVSPRRLPGFGPELVVADSDEHTPDGHLTEDLAGRVQMHDKRLRKLQKLGRELGGISTSGPAAAPLVLVCWGSSLGPVTEAVARLHEAGASARMVHLSELWPFPAQAVATALKGAGKLVMVEMNATGQADRLLRQETGIAADHLVLRYDGAPLTPEYILRGLEGHA